MRRKLFFLIAIIILAVGVVLAVKNFTSRGPKQGELRVDSQPTASIFLDDKHLGRTPYRDKVDAGQYTIKVVPESAASQLSSWEGKIKIGANLLTYVNTELADSELNSAVDLLWLEKVTSKNSEISVVTNPDGATVTVDDATKGVSPLALTDITPGDHAITISSPGFLTRTLRVKTTSGYRLIASVKMALSTGAPVATVTATATPSGTVSPTPKGSVTPKVSPTPIVAGPTPTPGLDPPKPFVVIKDTPTGYLRVRLEPSTGASEAARVNPGEKFHVYDSQNGWFQISYDGTNQGWISGQYATEVQ